MFKGYMRDVVYTGLGVAHSRRSVVALWNYGTSATCTAFTEVACSMLVCITIVMLSWTSLQLRAVTLSTVAGNQPQVQPPTSEHEHKRSPAS